MNATDESLAAAPKQRNFALLLVGSFALFNGAYILDQTIRWSDHWDGFRCGLVHVIFIGIAWCIYVFPWSLIVFALYRWRKWSRYRAFWILAPAWAFLVFVLGSLVLEPPIPSVRFRTFAKSELPSDAVNVRHHFSGGGVADYFDTYYFETTPQEVERLIADMKLEEDVFGSMEMLPKLGYSQPPGWPDFLSWEGARWFRGHDAAEHWFYNLVTDPTRTRVYVWVGCT
ncbi:MAG: hypothetical protein J0M04_10390 [Verrucomicrobia bacterium]|nr:hypothetical protein [Verrucomicrobiota bacterium]